MKQAIGQRCGELSIARHPVSGLHLSQDLGLANDERVQASRDPEQVTGNIGPTMHVQVLFDLFVREVMILAKEASDLIGGLVAVSDRINLRAIAGRKHHKLACDAAGSQFRKRGLNPFAREIHALPHLDGGGPVTQADCEEAHH
jgi:hypothetical protein